MHKISPDGSPGPALGARITGKDKPLVDLGLLMMLRTPSPVLCAM